jgi:hypothetical protein
MLAIPIVFTTSLDGNKCRDAELLSPCGNAEQSAGRRAPWYFAPRSHVSWAYYGPFPIRSRPASTRSSATASKISRVEIGTCIDPAGSLHERHQLRRWHLATSDVPQCPRPFADRLAVSVIVTSATNYGCKRTSILVKRKICEFKCAPQKLFCSPSHLIMGDDREHGLQYPYTASRVRLAWKAFHAPRSISSHRMSRAFAVLLSTWRCGRRSALGLKAGLLIGAGPQLGLVPRPSDVLIGSSTWAAATTSRQVIAVRTCVAWASSSRTVLSH